MAKEGWLSIRNVPDLTGNLGNAYFQELKEFFKENCLCPKCKGRGFKIDDEVSMIDYTTVRYGSIHELEVLKKMDVPMADVIRDILQRRVMDKKHCSLCHGSRFVDKDCAKEYTNNKRKKRGKNSTGIKKKKAS